METLKNIFFLFGSLMGMAAFVKTILEPLLESNRKRWAAIAERVSEDDLKRLEFDIGARYRIDCRYLDRIASLVEDIETDAEAVRFGPVLRQRYRDCLTRFATRYSDLREYVQVPYWEPVEVRFEDEKFFEYRLQKNFFEESEERLSYAKHLREAEKMAVAMRVEHRALSIMSSLSVIELPFVAWTVAKRAAIP